MDELVRPTVPYMVALEKPLRFYAEDTEPELATAQKEGT
jgi:hypothetical protein